RILPAKVLLFHGARGALVLPANRPGFFGDVELALQSYALGDDRKCHVFESIRPLRLLDMSHPSTFETLWNVWSESDRVAAHLVAVYSGYGQSNFQPADVWKSKCMF